MCEVGNQDIWESPGRALTSAFWRLRSLCRGVTFELPEEGEERSREGEERGTGWEMGGWA